MTDNIHTAQGRRKRAVSYNIQTVQGRSQLQPRQPPYWQRLFTHCHVGYRKLSLKSPGDWYVQVNTGDGKQVRKALEALDHLPQRDQYDAAKKAAEAFFLHLKRGGSTEECTVKQACEKYVAHLRAEGRESTAKDAQGRFKRLIDGHEIGRVPLRKLVASRLRQWRSDLTQKLVDIAPHAEEKRTRSRAASSVNRDMAQLKAALNFARQGMLVESDGAWRETLKPIRGASNRRRHYLDREQRRLLITHADDDLALFLRGLSALPLRPGALASLTAANFDARLGALTISKDKSGAGRTIVLEGAPLQIIRSAQAGRIGLAPLFSRDGGKPWNKDAWKKPMQAAVVAAGLPTGTTAYTIRHSVITDLIVGGLDTLTVARLAGTSLVMIEKHYGHLKASHAAAALERVAI